MLFLILASEMTMIELEHNDTLIAILSILWQLLVTKTNNYTSNKSLSRSIKWEVHKRTQQEVFAQLLSYLYNILMVCATKYYAYPNVCLMFVSRPPLLGTDQLLN